MLLKELSQKIDAYLLYLFPVSNSFAFLVKTETYRERKPAAW